MRCRERQRELAEAIGARVRSRRIYLGLSLRDLGKLIDADGPYVARVQRGAKTPEPFKLLKLCQALDLTPNQILGWEERR